MTTKEYKYASTMLILQAIIIAFLPTCHCYCTGNLRDRDIVGIWRLRSKKSFLPSLAPTQKSKSRPMKEFTVFPLKKKQIKHEKSNHDILLLLREDGNFVQYGSGNDDDDDGGNGPNGVNQVVERTSSLGTMKGSWGLVDGQLILAADRPKDVINIRSGSSKHDTMMAGKVVATSGKLLEGNPALAEQEGRVMDVVQEKDNEKAGGEDRSEQAATNEDVHLSVSGEISVGKFFYPLKHPSFFEQPMFGPTSTGSFELKQVLGTLNTQVDDKGKMVEKFRKTDLMDKRYFLTSYPLPTKAERQKKQRWSIKYKKYVNAKPMSDADKEREELEKSAPMQIKSFELALFSNNTFSTITGLGDTVLRGKWSVVGEERDQLRMNVWRFGFGRNVSGSTFSEGPHLSHLDDVSYWGEIYELDAAVDEDSIEDDPSAWKGTRIEINGAVMIGVLEPCSIAQFTMIEKTEDDYDEEDDDDDDDNGVADFFIESNRDSEDDEDLDELPFDIGSFE